jgi:hypothetical protein
LVDNKIDINHRLFLGLVAAAPGSLQADGRVFGSKLKKQRGESRAALTPCIK